MKEKSDGTYREKENGIKYHIHCSYMHDNTHHQFIDKYKWVKIFLAFDVDALTEPFTLTYYKSGKIHNDFGAAIISRDGIFNEVKLYFIEGKQIKEHIFNKIQRKKKLKIINGINTKEKI